MVYIPRVLHLLLSLAASIRKSIHLVHLLRPPCGIVGIGARES